MSSVPTNGLFWSALGVFWSDELISQWKAAVFGEKGTEVCSNLITLTPSVHGYWGKALFALKPMDVSDDGMSMDVQFFWLRQFHRLASMRVTTRPEFPSDLNGLLENVKLFNCETEEIIRSGTTITLRTDDPETKPLPSKEILDMQWVLNRLTALSGGAGALELKFASDSDSDGSFDLDISDEMALREGDATWEELEDKYGFGPTLTAGVRRKCQQQGLVSQDDTGQFA